MSKNTKYESFSDEQIVQGILDNDQGVIQYFFFEKCSSLFGYIIKSIFDGHVDRDELVNELFIFLQADDWYKVRQFDYRSKLTTWTSVVATRFFLKNKERLIENSSTENQIIDNKRGSSVARSIDRRIDLEKAISLMPNKKYQYIIRELDIKETHPEIVADRLHVSLPNLYNLHNRAHKQLSLFMKKSDYYD